MAAIQLVFVFAEHRPPLPFRLEVNEKLGIEKAGGIGAVIRSPGLTGTVRDLGKEQSMIRA